MSFNDEKPFLSTGRLVESYKLLVSYMKKCRESNIDCDHLIPSSQFLLEVKELVEKGNLSKFADLVNLVEGRYSELINCDLALRVFAEVHGHQATCELVKRMLITQLAGWIAEMLESLGYVRVKFSWR